MVLGNITWTVIEASYQLNNSLPFCSRIFFISLNKNILRVFEYTNEKKSTPLKVIFDFFYIIFIIFYFILLLNTYHYIHLYNQQPKYKESYRILHPKYSPFEIISIVDLIYTIYNAIFTTTCKFSSII